MHSEGLGEESGQIKTVDVVSTVGNEKIKGG